MQSAYLHKMEVFRARAKHRENLILAKEWFKSNIGLNPRDHRVFITRIKDLLMQGKED